jgi:hypothetical protein
MRGAISYLVCSTSLQLFASKCCITCAVFAFAKKRLQRQLRQRDVGRCAEDRSGAEEGQPPGVCGKLQRDDNRAFRVARRRMRPGASGRGRCSGFLEEGDYHWGSAQSNLLAQTRERLIPLGGILTTVQKICSDREVEMSTCRT